MGGDSGDPSPRHRADVHRHRNSHAHLLLPRVEDIKIYTAPVRLVVFNGMNVLAFLRSVAVAKAQLRTLRIIWDTWRIPGTSVEIRKPGRDSIEPGDFYEIRRQADAETPQLFKEFAKVSAMGPSAVMKWLRGQQQIREVSIQTIRAKYEAVKADHARVQNDLHFAAKITATVKDVSSCVVTVVGGIAHGIAALALEIGYEIVSEVAGTERAEAAAVEMGDLEHPDSEQSEAAEPIEKGVVKEVTREVGEHSAEAIERSIADAFRRLWSLPEGASLGERVNALRKVIEKQEQWVMSQLARGRVPVRAIARTIPTQLERKAAEIALRRAKLARRLLKRLNFIFIVPEVAHKCQHIYRIWSEDNPTPKEHEAEKEHGAE